MNIIEILKEEKKDLEKSLKCLQESLKTLNIVRDHDFHNTISNQKELIEKRLKDIEEELEGLKKSLSGLILKEKTEGNILTAKTKDGESVFLRIAYLPDRITNQKRKESAFFFDWVNKIEESCFIKFEDYKITETEFKRIYSYHKRNSQLEDNIKERSPKLELVIKEVNHNYLLKK